MQSVLGTGVFNSDGELLSFKYNGVYSPSSGDMWKYVKSTSSSERRIRCVCTDSVHRVQVSSVNDTAVLHKGPDQPLHPVQSTRRYASRDCVIGSRLDQLIVTCILEHAISKIKSRLREGYAFNFQVYYQLF